LGLLRLPALNYGSISIFCCYGFVDRLHFYYRTQDAENALTVRSGPGSTPPLPVEADYILLFYAAVDEGYAVRLAVVATSIRRQIFLRSHR